MRAETCELNDAVLGWWTGHQRDLPWRHTRDPWAVLVSEVMSQQTQVARVVPKWTAFLERFPTVVVAAEATPADLIEHWSGLGYNRRARNLHRTAVTVAERHDGVFPDDLDALLALPGIGPYTARALLAFAFEHDVGVVDTNVGRVLARTGGRALAPRDAQALADELVPPGEGWAWNQAVLDFAAVVCTKRAPSCGDCPVAEYCEWRGVGDDPAVGSAQVSSGQPRFEGSDRQGRGRFVRALVAGPVDDADLAAVMGWPDDAARAASVAERVRSDGLAIRRGSRWELPGDA